MDCLSKETYFLSEEGDLVSIGQRNVKRDPLSVKRDPLSVKRDPLSVKRDPLSVKRDLFSIRGDLVSVGQTRGIFASKKLLRGYVLYFIFNIWGISYILYLK